MSGIEMEFAYPVPAEEICRIKDSYESDAAAAKKEMRPIFATCLSECNSTPAMCDKHKHPYINILRALYTSSPWVPYRPATFVAEIHKMFDDNVDAKDITERVTKEIRRHNRDSICTVGVDDDGALRQLKLDAGAMYDDDKIPEDVIIKYIKDKREELIRLKSISEQSYLRAIFEIRPDDPKVLEIVKSELCTPRSSDSKRLKEFRAKWAAMISTGNSWTNVHKVMLADVAELTKAEKEQEEIRFAQIALEKEKARKEAEKQEKEARKAQRAYVTKQLLYSNHSGTCAGCQNIAVPEHATGAVLRCQVCKGLVERELQENDSYYCSKKCARANGHKHMLEKHPCTAGDDCVNPARHAFEVFAQYCPECWEKWGIVSYICNLPCYDKNWANHWTKTHVRIEEEFNQRAAKEKSIAKLKEEPGSSAKGKGKEVVAASESAAETHHNVKDLDVKGHDMADA